MKLCKNKISKKNKCYLEILKSCDFEYYKIGKVLCRKIENPLELKSSLVSGPVLYNYVKWVIDKASVLGIRDLYFLARDGFIMYLIAKRIIGKLQKNISCHYLFCSRRSLNLPLFSLDIEYAFDRVFIKGKSNRLKSYFEKMGYKEIEMVNELRQMGISDSPQILLDKELTSEEIEHWKMMLKNSTCFVEKVLDKSLKERKIIEEYLYQEGVFCAKQIAIVDSGWTGNTQKTLAKLLGREDIIGFYFGLYDLPLHMDQKKYFCYYFNPKNNIIRKTFFNPNVFECLCSAPHGSTFSYMKSNGKVVPLVYENTMSEEHLSSLRSHINGVMKFVNLAIKNIEYDYRTEIRMTFKLLASFMMFCSHEEIELYSFFEFGDDIGEGSCSNIIEQEAIHSIKDNLIQYMWIYWLFEEKRNVYYWTEALINRDFSKIILWNYIITKYIILCLKILKSELRKIKI